MFVSSAWKRVIGTEKSVPVFYGDAMRLDNVTKLCNRLRVKNGLQFSWSVSNEKGIWIWTADEMDNIQLDIVADAATLYHFKIVKWVTKEAFSIKLETT